MCVSLPGRVTKIDGPRALVEIDGRETWCSALAQPDVQIGDFVLIQADLIMAIICAEEAQEIIQLSQEMQALLDDEGEDTP
jgi:hydrogenase expression/formation protein HypC